MELTSTCLIFMMMTMVTSFPATLLKKKTESNKTKTLLTKEIMTQHYCLDDKECDSGYKCDTTLHQCQRPECTQSMDCPSGLVCDVQNKRCKSPTNFKEIIEKQRCSKVHKRRCSVDSQCGCNDGDYVCEDRECVPRKQTKVSAEGERCVTLMDCDFTLTCVQNKCTRESFEDPFKFLELYLKKMQKLNVGKK